MIDLQKISCCGCSACAQRCPKQCITMQEDEEGFLYPKVNTELCIDCGLCEKVCPCLNQSEPKAPISVEAFTSTDANVIRQSSSGGAFTQLAEYVLNKGGMVFGARFNEQWNVVHDYTDTIEGLKAFRGSKYLQSVIGDNYRKTEEFLKSGREVLFSGTPCQIAGLRKFLRKDYSNLLAVEIACHSVPSPLVWHEYLKGLKISNVADINFRDKRKGWQLYGLSVSNGKGKSFFQEQDNNAFMQLFKSGIITRPSCFNCPAKESRSGADITLGDCWGIGQMIPDYPDVQRGVNFVLCKTEKGLKEAQESGVRGQSISYEAVVANNGGLTVKAKEPKERTAFWADFYSGKDKSKVIHQYAKPYLLGLVLRMKIFVSRLLSKK